MSARRVTLLALAAPGLAVSLAHGSPLAPYQMVRSLQLVQDRIANGDQAAMPMQRKLLEIIDDRMRHAEKADFKDPKNFRSVFIYAMSGGNPATIRTVLSTLDLDDTNRKLSQGIVDYMQGSFGAARKRLEAINPMDLSPELGAFVALVRGAVLTQDDPKQALKMFDTARLLSPGTLVEEAALRRSLGVAATLGDAPRFTEDAWRYVSRYLHSPYASQFAEDFVSGVVALRETIDLKTVEEIVAGMSDEQAHFIYLRLARKGAIEGYKDLLAFASAKAEGFARKTPAGNDPRALLYSSIASVTSENVQDIKNTLAAIDENRLSESDQRLLRAAQSVADEVVTLPDPASAGAPDDGDPKDKAGTDRPGAETAVSTLPPAIKAAMAKQQGGAAASGDAPPATDVASATPASPAGAAASTSAYLTAARDKLEAIDKLLKENAR